jgi:hypothetical protein
MVISRLRAALTDTIGFISRISKDIKTNQGNVGLDLRGVLVSSIALGGRYQRYDQKEKNCKLKCRIYVLDIIYFTMLNTLQ